MEPGAREADSTDMHCTELVTEMTCLFLGPSGAEHADAVVPQACFGRRIVLDVPEEGPFSSRLFLPVGSCVISTVLPWAGLLRKREACEILLCRCGLFLTLA